MTKSNMLLVEAFPGAMAREPKKCFMGFLITKLKLLEKEESESNAMDDSERIRIIGAMDNNC